MNKKVTCEGIFQHARRRTRPEFSKNTQKWSVFLIKSRGGRANGLRTALAEDC